MISEEETKAKAIINWTVGFLLILQARYYISNATMNLLIRFISIVLKVLGQSSSLAARTGKTFFTSFHMLCKSVDQDSSFIKYTVCSICNQIYDLKQCIYNVGSQQYSKKCFYVQYPNHPQSRRRQHCSSLLLKTVEISSKCNEKILLPFKVYCYQSLEDSLKNYFCDKNLS